MITDLSWVSEFFSRVNPGAISVVVPLVSALLTLLLYQLALAAFRRKELEF
jgi:hypothetical protein